MSIFTFIMSRGCFYCSAFIFNSTIHLELTFKQVSSFTWISNYPSTITQENYFSLLCNAIFVINQVFRHVSTCFWAILFYICIFVFSHTSITVSQVHCFLFFFGFWLHLQHMEVLRPRSESKLHLQPMPQLQQHRSLTYCARLGVEPATPQRQVR